MCLASLIPQHGVTLRKTLMGLKIAGILRILSIFSYLKTSIPKASYYNENSKQAVQMKRSVTALCRNKRAPFCRRLGLDECN